MISWIKGEVVDFWQKNNKFFILINCQGLGYEIQILESIYSKLKTAQISSNIILWLKHIKKEDSDSLFGFICKEEKNLFVEILNIRGIGSQIGMAILNKFTLNQIINAIICKDKKLISSVPGLGQKMTERLILELESKLSQQLYKDKDGINTTSSENIEKISVITDIELTLESLNYQKREIKLIRPILHNKLNSSNNEDQSENKKSFEKLLKFAMDYLDNNNSKLCI